MVWPRERRQEYYARVKAVRGDAAAAVLIADVNREWRMVSRETKA